MTERKPIQIAVAKFSIDNDVRKNSSNIRHAMTEARKQGMRLVQCTEGALSGYVKSQVDDWKDVDWNVIATELERISAHAANLEIYVALGCNHQFDPKRRPYNSLFVIADDGTIATRYDKRYLSHTEIADWYSPGDAPCTFEIDGWRFGCALCIEVQFPAVFAEYEQLNVDCVLISSYSRDPMNWTQLQGHAACNNLWISLATPEQCSSELPGGVIGPNGQPLGRADTTMLKSSLDPNDPAFDTALNKARPWRRLARDGAIYHVP